MDWISYAKYSKYHPDNLVKVAHALPEPVRAPPPVLALNDIDKQMGGWGHKLCCERPYGQQETTTRIKAGVRVGRSSPLLSDLPPACLERPHALPARTCCDPPPAI